MKPEIAIQLSFSNLKVVIHLSFNKQNKFQRKNGPERTYERLAVSKIKPTWKLTIFKSLVVSHLVIAICPL